MTYNVTAPRTEDADQRTGAECGTEPAQSGYAGRQWLECMPVCHLLMMVAQVNDMVPGELVHMIADAHIYDRHVPMIQELLEREEHPAPKVSLNPDVKDFYQFTTKDLIVEIM
ncbi:MAG: thymidylate synthase [Lachnospiraceae bacterium]